MSLGQALKRRNAARAERQVWIPMTDTERAVLAALILAGKPVTNDELARLMGCSKRLRSGDAIELALGSLPAGRCEDCHAARARRTIRTDIARLRVGIRTDDLA